MLELQHPHLLLAWGLLPLLAWRGRRPGARAALPFSSLGLLRGGGGLRVALAGLPELLALLGLAALILALARPQLTRREQVVEREGIDIILAVDVSGSMEATDFQVGGRSATRLDVARMVVDEFVAGRPHDRLGLVVFGEEAFTQVPLTLDHESLRRFLGQLRIGMAGANATAIGNALAVATRRLAQLDAPSRVVILLTDGRSNAGQLSPEQAAELARAIGVKVYTIGVGSPEGERGGFMGIFRGPRAEEIDERSLTRVAEATGGRYFRATDTRSLQEIYETIDTLERSTAEVTEWVHRDELYRMALVPGLALLALGVLLETTWLRRLP